MVPQRHRDSEKNSGSDETGGEEPPVAVSGRETSFGFARYGEDRRE